MYAYYSTWFWFLFCTVGTLSNGMVVHILSCQQSQQHIPTQLETHFASRTDFGLFKSFALGRVRHGRPALAVVLHFAVVPLCGDRPVLRGIIREYLEER